MKTLLVAVSVIMLSSCVHVSTDLAVNHARAIDRQIALNNRSKATVKQHKVDPQVQQRRNELDNDLTVTVVRAMQEVTSGTLTINEFRSEMQEAVREDDANVAKFETDLSAELEDYDLANKDLLDSDETIRKAIKKINGEKQ